MSDSDHGRGHNDRMVAELVRNGAIADARIEHAFRRVLRHWFLPDDDWDDVYRDVAVVTHRGPDGVPVSSSSQPSIMARMLRQLDVRPGHRVLEIGTGTGYNAALLAQLVGADGQVTTVEVDPEICAAAEGHLAHARARNVSVLVGDGWAGTSGAAVFDRIEATVGVWDLPTAWVAQLEAGGIIVAPLWLRAGLQASVALKKLDGRLQTVSIEPCGFMRLRGPGAGQPAYQQMSGWTVSFDEASPARTAVLQRLLETQPHTEHAPALPPGWFTPIALRQPDAIHMFSLRPEGPVVRCGLLDVSPPGLAVVESGAEAIDTIETSGDEKARDRLLQLIDATTPIELSRLSITAVPRGDRSDDSGALTTLDRPNFSFVIGSS